MTTETKNKTLRGALPVAASFVVPVVFSALCVFAVSFGFPTAAHADGGLDDDPFIVTYDVDDWDDVGGDDWLDVGYDCWSYDCGDDWGDVGDDWFDVGYDCWAYDCGYDDWDDVGYDCWSYDCGYDDWDDVGYDCWSYDCGYDDWDYCDYDCYDDWDYCDRNCYDDYDYCDYHDCDDDWDDCDSGCHDDPEPVCEIDASDESIEEGDSTTLRWNTRYADDVTLSGHGDVDEDGSRTVSPNRTTTYTLRAHGDGGSDTCSVTVRVEEDDDDDDDDDEPSCELDVDDRSVEEGDEVTLEWETDNADYASINQGIGRVDEDGGEEDVEIEDDDDVTFRMTVRNDDGDEDTCSVTVRVDEDDENSFSSVDFDSGPVTNPPVVYLSNLPYTGVEDMSPSMLGFYGALIALLGTGIYLVFMKRQKVRA